MKTSFRIYRNIFSLDLTPCALTIGNFDGIHLGHQAILNRVSQEARIRNISASVLTFYPSSKEYFSFNNQEDAGVFATRISSFRDKLFFFSKFGINQVIVTRFNRKLASLSAKFFIQDLLIRNLKTRWLLVGNDFRFGHNREGDFESLKKAALKYGFEVQTISDIKDQFNQRISSSDVREALSLGNLPLVQRLLGRTFSISGHVIYGKQIGRHLGFPTINLKISKYFAMRTGIYIVKVHGLRNQQSLSGIASLGKRPTIENKGKLLLEVHLLDEEINAYGKLVRIEFLHRLRDEKKFQNLNNLILAVTTDKQDAYTYFRLHGL